MVEYWQKDKIKFFGGLLSAYFHIQQLFTYFKDVNKPDIKSEIYACWHAHQASVYGLIDKKHRKDLYVLISKSGDGEIISTATESLGFNVLRGSHGKKGAIEASKSMISLLKEDKVCVITVDGPRGPAKKPKSGIIKIAKLSGKPIIPVYWYSSDKTLLYLPSWDKLRMPLGFCRTINIYGTPIYVNPNGSEEDDEKIRLEIEKQLLELEEKAPEAWNDAWRLRLWKKKKSN